jgi:glycosyltransferase involved in cell wall biosynthesis
MKNNPKVSIVIPVYNGSNYLKEAIDSALAQTYKNIEIIVVNDGSTDNGATEKIAKSYGKKIRYYSKENGGVATALNLGIEKMKGEYFSWLSHDDLYYPDKVEKQIRFLNDNKLKHIVLYSNYEVIDKNSRHLAFIEHDHYMLTIKPEYALLRGCVNGITLLIPKDAFEGENPFDPDLRCTQDYELWRRIIRKYEFVHMDEILSKTREHAGQDSVNHPRILVEGNPLWIGMMEDLSVQTKKRLEGSEYVFYLNMYFHLRKSPYKEAAEFAKEKAHKLYAKLAHKVVDKDPLISVIIPCYNQGKYVDDAVESILKQTYKNYEIIIINDGSTDEYTNKLLSDYHKPKTRVYTTNNQGLTLARNYGVSAAKGGLIQLLDADDYISPEKFEAQVKVFRAAPVTKVVYTSYQYYFEKENEYKPPFHGLAISSNPVDDFIYRWQRGLSIPIHCAMFRKEVFNSDAPFVPDIKALEDWIMWVDIANRGAKFAMLNEDMATYRVQEKSMTQNGEHMFYWACRAVAYIADRYVKPDEANRFDKAQQGYLKFLANYLLLGENKEGETTPATKQQLDSRTARYLSRIPKNVKKSLPYRAARMVHHKGLVSTVKAAKKRIVSHD